MNTALVTGASQGLGRALVLDLAKDGWQLVLDARREAPLLEVAEMLEGIGAEVRTVVGDVADPAHREALAEAVAALGGLDLLVNNASTLGPTPLPRLAEYDVGRLRHVYEVNVLAPLALVQHFLPELRASRGAIVAISSDAAVEPYEGWGGYGSSKAALDQLHRVLAVEEPGVAVYSFDPGDMRTEMHQAAFPGEDISDRPPPDEVVPVLRRLLWERPASGRYKAGQE